MLVAEENAVARRVRSLTCSAILAIAAALSGCLLFAAPGEAGCKPQMHLGGFGFSTSTDVVRFTIGKLPFAIPRNDFRMESDICDGHTTTFLLRVFYPSFAGATEDTIDALQTGGRWGNRVQILAWEKSNGPLRGILIGWTKYYKTTRRTEPLYGMQVIDYDFVGNHWEVYFSPSFDAPAVIGKCAGRIGGPYTTCAELIKFRGLQITLEFDANLLPERDRLVAGVKHFIEGLIEEPD